MSRVFFRLGSTALCSGRRGKAWVPQHLCFASEIRTRSRLRCFSERTEYVSHEAFVNRERKRQNLTGGPIRKVNDFASAALRDT